MKPKITQDAAISLRFKLLCQYVNLKKMFNPHITHDQARAAFLATLNSDPSKADCGWQRTGFKDEDTFRYLFGMAWQEAGKLN